MIMGNFGNRQNTEPACRSNSRDRRVIFSVGVESDKANGLDRFAVDDRIDGFLYHRSRLDDTAGRLLRVAPEEHQMATDGSRSDGLRIAAFPT
jgi:hypothetical protein